jgi:hypothetical protein
VYSYKTLLEHSTISTERSLNGSELMPFGAIRWGLIEVASSIAVQDDLSMNALELILHCCLRKQISLHSGVNVNEGVRKCKRPLTSCGPGLFNRWKYVIAFYSRYVSFWL